MSHADADDLGKKAVSPFSVASTRAAADQDAANTGPLSVITGPSSNKGRGQRRPSSSRQLSLSLQQLSLSEAGAGTAPERPARRPSPDAFLPWPMPAAHPHIQDPYGQYRFSQGGQQYPAPVQWMPFHPGMGYGMYGDSRGPMPFDPRYQNMPYRPGSIHYPPQMQGPYGGVPDPNYQVMPMTYVQPRQQMQSARQRPPRSPKLPVEHDKAYEFDIDEVQSNSETCRKTLMLRNIPNKYSIHMLLEMLDKAQREPGKGLIYDFCYLPIDFKNRCNLGYAFVNFVDAQSTLECFQAFHGKRWNDFNSKKVCEVKYGRVQGREALIEHFKNSKFPSNDIDSLPLLFEQIENADGTKSIQSVPLHSRQVPFPAEEP